jgi:phosphomannomutase
MTHYLFDIDGTLTASRQQIDSEFANWFYNFQLANNTYCVTGSDPAKTIEQCGEKIVRAFDRSYFCLGNQAWKDNKCYYVSDWSLSKEQYEYISVLLKNSVYPYKTGNHIETRVGLVNVSTVGRNATIVQRNEYSAWDQVHNERAHFANAIMQRFTDLQVDIGGMISVDIIQKGKDKSQILKDFSENENIMFFGDRLDIGGNDHLLATAITARGNVAVQVSGWQETRNILRHINKTI